MTALRGKPVLGGLAVAIIFVLVLPYFYPTVQAQTENKVYPFTAAITFEMPNVNGSIHFAVNGSYSSATLAGDVWTFRDLKLGNSRNTANISIQAENCDITIFSASFTNFSGRGSIRYNVDGIGTQSVRFIDLKLQTHSYEWGVVVPDASGASVWLSEGQNWSLQPNNTIEVHGILGNVSVSRYFFGGGVSVDKNLPFQEQHSIAIVTAAVLAVVVAVALVIRVHKRRR